MSPRTRRPLAGLAGLAATSSLVLAGLTAPAPSVAVPPTVGDRTAVPAERAPAPVKIRFLQYNIRFGAKGLDGVARDIRRTGAQVVLLNEVDDRTGRGGVHQARYLARKLDMQWVYDPNTQARPGIRGNALLTSLDIVRFRRFDLPAPAGTEPRGLMRVRLKQGSLRFDAWTTHLNPGAGKLAQARTVRDRIGTPRCATVLGGDMNAGPTSRESKVLRSNLSDLWRRIGEGPGHTNGRATARIDYLYSAQARPKSAWVTPLRHSDHRGVVGTYLIDPRRGC